jgi:hypothetical protein
MDILSDDRVQWIRQKVVLALDISIECFNEYFTETLERARAAGIAKEELMRYLSERCGTGSALFFASHSWTEQIEGKIIFFLNFFHRFFVILMFF